MSLISGLSRGNGQKKGELFGMKKVKNKFTTAIILFLLSMFIWKISSLKGHANIFYFMVVSILDTIGFIIIISNNYQLEQWDYGERWLYDCNRWVTMGLVAWSVILCVQILDAASLLDSYRQFTNVSLVSYPALQVSYLIQGILTMVMPVFYTAALIKTSKKSECIRTSQYIQQQKAFCRSYVSVVILCQLISVVFLNTGEHRSTPTLNLLLNLLYFGMLIYLHISLYRFWRRTQILLSATESIIDSNEDEVGKSHRLRRIWIMALMCTVVFGCGAIVNYSVERDFWYVEEKKGELVLKEYTGQRPYVKIPEYINGKQVVRLDSCFERKKFIKRVSIPQGVTLIGSNAFASCVKLNKVEIPNGVEEIGYGAFRSCRSLTKLIIPDSVLIIEDEAFADCSGLRRVILPEKIEKIGRAAFKSCRSLEEIALPEGLTLLPEELFDYCLELVHATLPQSIKWIDGEAFAKCEKLETVQIPENLDYIASDAFSHCESLKSEVPKTSFADWEEVIVPEGVIRIPEDMFRNCHKLEYIHLPESLREIERMGFAGCTGLKKIVIPEGVTAIHSKTFFQCNKLETVEMPGVSKIASDAFWGCTKLQNNMISEEETFSEQDVPDQEPDEVVIPPLEREPYIRPSEQSADLLSGQISIGGEMYQLPLHYEDFTACGLIIEADTEEIVAPGAYRYVEVADGDNRFKIEIENIDSHNRPLKECYVTAVILQPDKIPDLKIVLPGGLKLQDCSREEIETRYGKPQEIFDDKVKLSILSYKGNGNTYVDFQFDKEDMSLTEVCINIIPEVNLNKKVADKSTRMVPLLFIVPLKINGEAYKFPMTYEAFTGLGWKNDYSEDEMVKANDFIGGYFTMGENKCQALIDNFKEQDVLVRDCTITGIQIISSQCKDLDVRLTGGLDVMQCTQETVKEIYGLPSDESYDGGMIDTISYYDNIAKIVVDFYFFSNNKELKMFSFHSTRDYLRHYQNVE